MNVAGSEVQEDTVHDIVAFVIGVLTALIFRWSAWKWPSGYHQKRDDMERDETSQSDSIDRSPSD